MKLHELEMLINFVATIFILISFITYYVGSVVYMPLLIISVLCVIVAKWIELIDRMEDDPPEYNHAQIDNHMDLIKKGIKNTFPNIEDDTK